MFDFDRFIRACKKWPASGPVQERGELVPTYLLEMDDESLIYGDLPMLEGALGRSFAADELRRHVSEHEPRAFAVILPIDFNSSRESAGRAGMEFPGSASGHLEGVIVQAWSLEEEVLFIGLYDDPTDIDWQELKPKGGDLLGLFAQVVTEWRRRAERVEARARS